MGRSTTMASSVAPNSFTSWRLAPATISESGAPRPSTSKLRLVPFFPPVCRVISNCLLSQRGLALRPIQTLPLPSDPLHLVILRQPGSPQPHKESLLPPSLKMRMDRAGAAKHLGQGLPLTPRAQHIHDGGENIARRNALAAPARSPPELTPPPDTRIARWQQRFNPRPKVIGHFPGLDSRHRINIYGGEISGQILFTDKLLITSPYVL